MALNGDDYLSGLDAQLWSMTYHILLKFRTPVLFKIFMGDTCIKKSTLLQWFVPSGSSFEAIEYFILGEFKEKIRKDRMITDKIYSIGFNVQVLSYSGIPWYIESEHLTPLIEILGAKFIDEMKKKYKDKE